MEEYLKKYKRLLILHRVFIIGYCAIAMLAFLGGLTGIVIFAVKGIDSLISICAVVCLVVPIVMLILYLVCLQWLWDKRFERQNGEIQNSDLSSDEIMELGKKLNIDLFGIAVAKRCEELGIEHLPEGYIRDAIMPKAEDFVK